MIWFFDAQHGWQFSKRAIATQLLKEEPVEVGSWHSKPVEGNMLKTREITGAVVHGQVSSTQSEWAEEVGPNLPWAEAHFLERVSGIPHNPPPSHVDWPFAHAQHQTVPGEKFSHTYPERFWGAIPAWDTPGTSTGIERRQGFRFEYGDLADLTQLLRKDPMTRQAWIPIYWPEDTGLSIRHPGERVPCSLGYHFMNRDGFLHMNYVIRSCDFWRHWSDDVYMAGRLLQEVCENLEYKPKPGFLTATFFSLHSMVGDDWSIGQWLKFNGGDRETV